MHDHSIRLAPASKSCFTCRKGAVICSTSSTRIVIRLKNPAFPLPNSSSYYQTLYNLLLMRVTKFI